MNESTNDPNIPRGEQEMFRYTFSCALINLFTVICIAQTSGDTSRTHAGARFGAAADARISVVRLREPRKAQQLYNKALNSWAEQKPEEAEHWLDLALKIYPTFPEALTLRGGIEASLGHWTRAEQSLQVVIQMDPGYSAAYVLLAGVYNSKSRFQDAQEASEQALSAGAENWDVQYEIARAMIGKEQYESALAVTEAALGYKRHGSLLHLAKAHALVGLLRYRQAAAELRTFLHYQPSGDGSEQAHALLDALQSAVGE
jgi:tetratricopeptide (TPR) repeat protein